MPVLIMTDECVGHMTERVVIPEADQIDLEERHYTDKRPGEAWPFQENGHDISPLLPVGAGHRFHVTGLTHDQRGYPVINPEAQAWNVQRLIDKVRKHADDIIRLEEEEVDGADVVVMAYGISSRVVRPAIDRARKTGLKVGLIKLVTVWPFPEQRVRDLASRVGALVMVEMNHGQLYYEMERCARGQCRTALVGHAGGTVHKPNDVFAAIKESLK